MSKELHSLRDESRSERIEARISRSNKELLELAAEITGQTLSGFIVSSLSEIARSTIERASRMQVTHAESRAFVDSLLNPPNPAPDLKRGFALYNETVLREQ